MRDIDEGLAAERGLILASLLSRNDAWAFAVELEERQLDEPLRTLAALLRR